MIRRALSGSRGLVVAALAAGALAGGAVAYWSGVGQGSAEVLLADAKPLVLSPGVPSAHLYPGGKESVFVTAANPNPYVVHVGSLALDTSAGTGGFEVDAAHSACDVSTLSFTTNHNGGLGWAVPPRSDGVDGPLPIQLTDALAMNASAASACQGATFTVHLLAAG